jgi:hypothetical protein
MRSLIVLSALAASVIAAVAQVQPPPPPNPPAPVPGGGFPPASCVTANGVIFNNATAACDAGLVKTPGATGAVTFGGPIIGPGGSAASTTYNFGTAGTGIFGTSGLIEFSIGGTLWGYFNNAPLTLVLGNAATAIEFGNGAATYINGDGGAGVVQAGTTSGNSATGAFKAAAFENGGSVPTTTGSTCGTIGAQVGGNTAGTIVATCTAQTLILNFSTTAPNGWACDMQDQSTPADSMKQTANSATSVTFTGTTVASDVLVWKCMAF